MRSMLQRLLGINVQISQKNTYNIMSTIDRLEHLKSPFDIFNREILRSGCQTEICLTFYLFNFAVGLWLSGQ